MLHSVKFENFRVLRKTTLPLSKCSLLLGPNGSGKSTVFAALQILSNFAKAQIENPPPVPGGISPKIRPDASDLSVGAEAGTKIEVVANWSHESKSASVSISSPQMNVAAQMIARGSGDQREEVWTAKRWLKGIRIFSLDPSLIAKPAHLRPDIEIQSDGSNLAAALTLLQSIEPERFDRLNQELAAWLPEYDRLLFDTGTNGDRSLMLRTRIGRHAIRAENLSHGTLLAVCILGISYLPVPPTMVCLEEPDRGVHPRLLRQVHDAMMRLSNPSDFGDQREPVQVLATTHSPYLLDLFRDHPEDVVLAEKKADGATFHRLTDMPHYKEIIDDAPLGDAWYTGILGGVPATS